MHRYGFAKEGDAITAVVNRQGEFSSAQLKRNKRVRIEKLAENNRIGRLQIPARLKDVAFNQKLFARDQKPPALRKLFARLPPSLFSRRLETRLNFERKDHKSTNQLMLKLGLRSRSDRDRE